MLFRLWWTASSAKLTNRREILKFTFSTNVSNTINLVARDGELLWIGALLTPLYAGYYKTAMTVINLILLPINPFIDTTYPEMVWLFGERKFAEVKRLLKHSTVLSGGWTIACALGLIVIGHPRRDAGLPLRLLF